MNLNNSLCKHFDKEKREYVTLSDIVESTLYMSLLLLFIIITAYSILRTLYDYLIGLDINPSNHGITLSLIYGWGLVGALICIVFIIVSIFMYMDVYGWILLGILSAMSLIYTTYMIATEPGILSTKNILISGIFAWGIFTGIVILVCVIGLIWELIPKIKVAECPLKKEGEKP